MLKSYFVELASSSRVIVVFYTQNHHRAKHEEGAEEPRNAQQHERAWAENAALSGENHDYLVLGGFLQLEDNARATASCRLAKRGSSTACVRDGLHFGQKTSASH